MSEQTVARHAGSDADSSLEYNFSGSIAVVVLAAALLATTARTSAVALLIGVAVVQAVIAVAWIFGTAMPGRVGGLVISALAAAGADVAVSLFPHGRLGTLIITFGLAVPALFVHQLARTAARVRVLDSLGAIAFLVLTLISLSALVQLRHEFAASATGGRVVSAVVVAAGAALVVGFLVDLVMPAPRFDATVPRGLLGVVASAGLGGSIGHLLLRSNVQFLDGRGAFVGAAVGAIVAFFAVAVAFIEASTPMPGAGFARRVRPVLGAVVPLGLLAPIAFLVCLAVRA